MISILNETITSSSQALLELDSYCSWKYNQRNEDYEINCYNNEKLVILDKYIGCAWYQNMQDLKYYSHVWKQI